MMGLTHLGGGLLTGMYLSTNVQGIPAKAFIVTASGLGSLLPDIDHKHSLFNKLTGLGFLAPLFGEHRGVTHSLIGNGVAYFIGSLVDKITGFSLAAGYLSHLLLDSLTMSGVRFLYPSKERTSLEACRVGDTTECVIGTILWCIVVFLAVRYIGTIRL